MNKKFSFLPLITVVLFFVFDYPIFSQSDSVINPGNIKFSTTQGFIDSTKSFLKDTSKNISDTNFKPNKSSEIVINKIEKPEINIDGELNEVEWQKAAKFENFSEIDPGDNIKPEVQTEVYMFYDVENLYIGYVCNENRMDKVRKTLCARDNIFNDDFVGIILDTYKEGKQSFELFVNPYGIQADLMRNSYGNEDASYDAIWYSDAKIHKDKWTVEIKVPFKSLRFPETPTQEWNLHILRIRPRDNRYQYSWIEINRDSPTLFTVCGKIKGIKNIKSGNNLEILPYFVASQEGNISDKEDADSPFHNEDIMGQFGFNVKYGITSNLTADFTYNPDFSQIESDAGVINVNNTYAIFYPEKRPFFIEGANIFDSDIYTVYTRTINNPLFAFKLTGKIGKYDIGYLTGYDRKTPFIIPFSENSDFHPTERRSLSNIFRVKRALYGESYIGFIMTDREVNNPGTQFLDVDGYNRNIGIDGSLRFFENFSFQFMFLNSITREINDTTYKNTGRFDYDKYSNALDGEYFSGIQTYLNLNKSSRNWNFSITYSSSPPEIRRDNGFISSNDYRTFSTWQGYLFYLEKGILLRMETSVQGSVRYNFNWDFKEVYFMPQIWLRFVNQISTSIRYLCVNNEEFRGVFLKHANRVLFDLNVNSLQEIRGGMSLAIGKYIVRNDNPYVGWGFEVSLWGDIKPIKNIVISPSLDYFELSESYMGSKIYAGYIFRTTGVYQISKPLSLRLITELNTFSSTFSINPLVSFKPNPFTVFYLGFTSQYDQLVPQTGYAKYVISDRQLFLKIQYLFRI